MQDALLKLTGEQWAVKYEIRPPSADQSNPQLVPEAVTVAVASTVDQPLFQGLKDHLDARMVRVDDGFGATAPVLAIDDDTETAQDWAEED
ncbi:MAG: hypothetical protein K1X57_02430 [Gemmataceae bacterium]|nr:hypothetical protein [Gemmataceae bacterium]